MEIVVIGRSQSDPGNIVVLVAGITIVAIKTHAGGNGKGVLHNFEADSGGMAPYRGPFAPELDAQVSSRALARDKQKKGEKEEKTLSEHKQPPG